mmetsp:Transcript_97588/g.276078  ORF Transcript_97588/g.276078 Transcript_97588/m.276078 type:complete len:455 (+) Transcript_97588:181-1545(+)
MPSDVRFTITEFLTRFSRMKSFVAPGRVQRKNLECMFEGVGLDSHDADLVSDYIDSRGLADLSIAQLMKRWEPLAQSMLTPRSLSKQPEDNVTEWNSIRAPTAVQEVFDRIGLKASQRFRSIAACFRQMHTGTHLQVTRNEFVNWVASSLLLPWSDADFAFDFMDQTGAGLVTYETVRFMLTPCFNGDTSYVPESMRDCDLGPHPSENGQPMDFPLKESLLEFGRDLGTRYESLTALQGAVNPHGLGKLSRKDVVKFCMDNGMTNGCAHSFCEWLGGDSRSVSNAKLMKALEYLAFANRTLRDSSNDGMQEQRPSSVPSEISGTFAGSDRKGRSLCSIGANTPRRLTPRGEETSQSHRRPPSDDGVSRGSLTPRSLTPRSFTPRNLTPRSSTPRESSALQPPSRPPSDGGSEWSWRTPTSRTGCLGATPRPPFRFPTDGCESGWVRSEPPSLVN